VNPRALAKENKRLRRELEAEREKALAGYYPVVPGSGGWTPLIREPFTGAWQKNAEINVNTTLSYSAVFACISLIASDIAKLRMTLVAQDSNSIWQEVDGNSPFWGVLKKPNRYQTTIQFFRNWVHSKLIHGNTYVLKARDARPVVTQLYVLDPTRVTILCAPDGSVFYELRSDHLTGLTEETVTVPAVDVIHDRWNEFFHPLVGISPITAAGLAATQGLKIQQGSAQFFASGANPGGVLTAPGFINEETARRLKEYWDTNYSTGGPNVGKVAVLGDGLKYEPMMMSATDAQLLEQLKWTAETVCSVFRVPPHMIGISPPPTYNNIEALNQAYYSQCLQILIEDIEKLLDEGVIGAGTRDPMGRLLGTWFDTETGLFRMDTASRVKAAADAIGSGAMAPNEARFRYFDLGPVAGGESPYLQQQYYSLQALSERDQDEPFSKPTEPPPGAPAAETEDDGDNAGVADGGNAAERAFDDFGGPIIEGTWSEVVSPVSAIKAEILGRSRVPRLERSSLHP
jgi:HK97 family phage portal protein